MATRARRVLLLAALALASAPPPEARAARFGDRLAPRVPAPYAGRSSPAAAAHPAPAAPRANLPADTPGGAEYEDTSDEETAETSGASDEASADSAEERETVSHVERAHQSHEESVAPNPRRPSRTEAHRLEMSTEYFVVPERAPAPVAPPRPPPPPPPLPVLPSSTSAPPDEASPAPPTGALRSEPWAVPVLALACACMVTLAGFEAFVVWGARRTAPSRRHLLLGQTLLLGLFSCAATAALSTATPTAFSCGAIRFGAGASYAVVFASLLVKCVFLLSLNGGVYLPAAYQALLLFFAVMIQVAIGAQWLGGTPPRALAGRCAAPLSDLLLSLCYAAFLIALVAGVALRSRGIRDNFREATHIAAAAGATAAVWVSWVAAALGAAERHRDACVAAGLLATCALVFAIMFAPKGRRLVAIGKEGRYDADRDEGLSSLGRAGSGYSPSFFHFKPVKYGIVTAAPAAPPPAPPPPPDHKEPPTQPSDRYAAAMAFASTSHFYARSLHPPQYYPHHNLPPPFHYHYSPYHYMVPPPGLVVRSDDGNVYTTLEPTLSSNPNVYFHRSDGRGGGGLHPGMMY